MDLCTALPTSCFCSGGHAFLPSSAQRQAKLRLKHTLSAKTAARTGTASRTPVCTLQMLRPWLCFLHSHRPGGLSSRPTGSVQHQAQQLLSSPLSLLPAAGQEHRIIPPNKKTYQQDPANYREALRESRLDEAEGADIMMVKPGLPYLDIIRLLRDNSTLPIAAYHVSGKLPKT